ncbi:MAG: zinc ABC transporter substrate-binding protein, partial [Candidatus Bathyarchaeia archaeon]
MLSNKIDIATIVALMSLLLTTRASEAATNSSSGIIIVVVSIDVLRSIVSPIIGEAGEVYSIVSGAVEPHIFTLTLEAVNIARRSDLIVITGHMEWEKKLVNLVAEEKGVSPDLISVNAMNLSWIKI